MNKCTTSVHISVHPSILMINTTLKLANEFTYKTLQNTHFFLSGNHLFPEVATEYKLEKYVHIDMLKSYNIVQEVTPVGVPPFC